MKCPPVSSSSKGTRPSFCGLFTDHDRIKVLCNGGRVSFTLYSENVGSRFEGRPFFSHSKKLRFCGYGRVHSHGSEWRHFASEEAMGEEDIDDGPVPDELSCFRGLVLDISYRPINVVGWQRAICLEFMDKADVLEYYDQTVSSPSGSYYIPAVLRVPHLLQVVKKRRVKHTLSRKNIFYRDSFACQYCSSTENLTIDHVLPISRGGEWEWENLVTACSKCNSKKGQKTLEEAKMKLIKIPKVSVIYSSPS
ncbi:uncharacterized protein LOC18421442 isoform X2 [Amborella trichopoda]|uniref:uncharacterized protein LOC18421442 isoform X2 n=1 Tax=Amborella trichopoda TaxID=13333 RepID=UPI0005D4636E|nr:uncharacterized protein LOC18421442 isoform X2 [Amborella trichopoda]|eukprot:XP_011622763.1 uncharacterized protein LOC18421442 isoform X2 [Amborella trichopoda]